jgi:hypothetical protein
MSIAPVNRPGRSIRNVFLLFLSLVVAAAAYTAVIRPANAQDCAAPEVANGIMLLEVGPHETEFHQAVWAEAGAPPDGIDATLHATQLQLAGDLPRCPGENGLPSWAPHLIAFSTYVATGMAVAGIMQACLPECAPYVAGVAGGIAGAVEGYVSTGLDTGDWGRAALASALRTGLQSAALSGSIGLAFTGVPTTVGDLLRAIESRIAGSGWLSWLNAIGVWRLIVREAGAVQQEIEMVGQELGLITG